MFHINISIKNNVSGASNCSSFCVEKSSHNFTAIMLIFRRQRRLTTLFELFSKIVPRQVKPFVAMIAFDKGNLVVLYLQTHLVITGEEHSCKRLSQMKKTCRFL